MDLRAAAQIGQRVDAGLEQDGRTALRIGRAVEERPPNGFIERRHSREETGRRLYREHARCERSMFAGCDRHQMHARWRIALPVQPDAQPRVLVQGQVLPRTHDRRNQHERDGDNKRGEAEAKTGLKSWRIMCPIQSSALLDSAQSAVRLLMLISNKFF